MREAEGRRRIDPAITTATPPYVNRSPTLITWLTGAGIVDHVAEEQQPVVGTGEVVFHPRLLEQRSEGPLLARSDDGLTSDRHPAVDRDHREIHRDAGEDRRESDDPDVRERECRQEDEGHDQEHERPGAGRVHQLEQQTDEREGRIPRLELGQLGQSTAAEVADGDAQHETDRHELHGLGIDPFPDG